MYVYIYSIHINPYMHMRNFVAVGDVHVMSSRVIQVHVYIYCYVDTYCYMYVCIGLKGALQLLSNRHL